MVNLDMVGRLRDGVVYVGGVDGGDTLRAWVTDAARGLALRPELRGDPFGPSDHTAFYAAGVPVLFLFTGAHGDYHRPTDTWDKLNPQGLELVTAFTARIVLAAAGAAAAPLYVRAQPAPAGEPRRGGYGPVFGVVPDFGESAEPGARISGVRPGSPAEKAGMRAGDIIVQFAGVTVTTQARTRRFYPERSFLPQAAALPAGRRARRRVCCECQRRVDRSREGPRPSGNFGGLLSSAVPSPRRSRRHRSPWPSRLPEPT